MILSSKGRGFWVRVRVRGRELAPICISAAVDFFISAFILLAECHLACICLAPRNPKWFFMIPLGNLTKPGVISGKIGQK